MNTAASAAPRIECFFCGTGELMAACVSGIIGDVMPEANRAIPEIPVSSFSLLAGSGLSE